MTEKESAEELCRLRKEAELYRHMTDTAKASGFDDLSDALAVALRHRRECPVSACGSTEMPSVPLRLTCPSCGELHVDEGVFENTPHHTHACRICGMVWRPAICATVGVRFLPGFRNES